MTERPTLTISDRVYCEHGSPIPSECIRCIIAERDRLRVDVERLTNQRTELYCQICHGNIGSREACCSDRDKHGGKLCHVTCFIANERDRLRVENEQLRESVKVAELRLEASRSSVLNAIREEKRILSENVQLREAVADRERQLADAAKVIADRGICERDCTLPLAQRIDNLIVDLRTDEYEAAEVCVERDRLREVVGLKPGDTLLSASPGKYIRVTPGGSQESVTMMHDELRELEQLRADVARLTTQTAAAPKN